MNDTSQLFHPLSGQPVAISRRAMIAGAACAFATNRYVSASQPDATPEVAPQGDEAAVKLLQKSAAVMAALKTFAFEMETVQGTSTILTGFELKAVEGVVRRPTDMDVVVHAKTPIGDISLQAISLDGTFYVQDPMADGAWTEYGQIGELSTTLNPDWILQMAVRQIREATVTGEEKIDGEKTRVIEGTFDPGQIVGIAADSAGEDVSSYLAGEPVDVTFWINQDSRIVEAEFFGPIMAAESTDVTRVISLFDFDVEVEIELPENIGTPTR